MFRILNASATENIQLAFAGHEFEVVALDGNPVPTPRKVAALALGTGGTDRCRGRDEQSRRLDPGLDARRGPAGWDGDRDRVRRQRAASRNGSGSRARAMGLHASSGEPAWRAAPDQVIPMVFGKINGGRQGLQPLDDQREGLRAEHADRRSIAASGTGWPFGTRLTTPHPGSPASPFVRDRAGQRQADRRRHEGHDRRPGIRRRWMWISSPTIPG